VCGSNYPTIGGIHHLISEKVSEECFFPDDAFDLIYRSEERNFWYRVRNKIIGSFITRYLPPPCRILEVGCGTGYVSRYLKNNGYHINCADFSMEALYFCRKRGAGDQYYQINLMEGIIIEEYEGICAFDVLEHIDDDETVLYNLHSALKPDGYLFITVPADMRIWSGMDVYEEHKRRYSKFELQNKLKKCGFQVERISYFMMFLYPVLLLTRRFLSGLHKKDTSGFKEQIEKNYHKEFQPNVLLNFVFFFIFSLECPIIRFLNFPFGSSLICVAVKDSKYSKDNSDNCKNPTE